MTDVEAKPIGAPFTAAGNGNGTAAAAAAAAAAAGISMESPASSSKRLLDLVASESEPVQQRRHVHVVFVYHPDVDVTHSTLPADIAQCIQNLYMAHDASVYVAQVRYGWNRHAVSDGLDDGGKGVQRKGMRSSEEDVQVTGFTQIDDFIASRKEGAYRDTVLAYGRHDDIACRRIPPIWKDELQKRFPSDAAKEENSTQCSRRVVDGLVAAAELFAAYSVLIAPVGRYIVHLVPADANLDLRETTFPLRNTDTRHDKASWQQVTTELGEIAALPLTIAVGPQHEDGLEEATEEYPPLPEQATTVHNSIVKHLSTALPSTADAPSVLGTQYDLAQLTRAALLLGLNAAAAQASKDTIGSASLYLSRKRARKDNAREPAAASADTEKAAAGSTTAGATDTQGNAVASVPFAQGIHAEKNKQTVQKAAFIQQLQQIMIRTLKAIKEKQMRDAPTDTVQIQNIDKVKEQLMQHHEALRRELQAMHNAGRVPDLGALLHALITIDEEALQKGMKLGGPCHIPALMTKHRQRQQEAGQAGATSSAVNVGEQPTSAQAAAAAARGASDPAQTGLPTETSNAAAAQRRPGSSQAVWVGAISWTIALPNSKRSQAATIVAAQCAPSTNQKSLMLPWPTKLQVSEVQTVSLSALQQYASTNGIPCILFQPHAPATQTQDGQQRPPGVPTQQQNESMYMMLARMIDSKKGCALLKLQGGNASPDAGIVVIPTAPPGGGSVRRLLGLVFDKAVPWHLFAPQQSREAFALAAAAGVAVSTASGANQPAPEAAGAQAAPVPQQVAEQPAAPAQAVPDATLSTAQLNQQLPLWARPQGAAAGTVQTASAPAQPQQQPAVQQPAMSAGNGNTTQPSAQSVQIQNLFAGLMGGAAGGSSDGNGGAPTLPANIDLEALQRMLNLHPS